MFKSILIFTLILSLQDFSQKYLVFPWDIGHEPAMVDSGDVLFDFTIPCDPLTSVTTEQKILNRNRISNYKFYSKEILDHFKIDKKMIKGSILYGQFKDPQ